MRPAAPGAHLNACAAGHAAEPYQKLQGDSFQRGQNLVLPLRPVLFSPRQTREGENKTGGNMHPYWGSQAIIMRQIFHLTPTTVRVYGFAHQRLDT
jgi:hypothetical protein